MPLDPKAVDTPMLSIAGNEGVGVITELGRDNTSPLKVGDRVILDKSQLGAWATHQNVDLQNLVKVNDRVSDVAAATIRASYIPFLIQILPVDHHRLSRLTPQQPSPC